MKINFMEITVAPRPKSYIELFFDRYPAFHHNASRPVMDEFDRLCDAARWGGHTPDADEPMSISEGEIAEFNHDLPYDWGDDEEDEARALFRDALVQEFNLVYGTDENDIGSWQGLCRVLDIVPIPDDLETCRRVRHVI
jgi:hypothetical protein